MTECCEHCGTSNRPRANFCAGCAAKLPGFVATGPSALELLDASAPRGLAAASRSSDASGAAGDMASLPRRMVVGGLLVAMAFMAWYLYVTRTVDAVAVPARDGPVVLQPAFQALGSLEPQLDALPGVSQGARAVAARTARTAQIAANALVDLPVNPPADGAAETVARFYRALSAGDGTSAAGYVTPAKRTHGPLSGQAMTTFYRALAQPLAIRSVRQLGADVVEARYTYRATRSICEGRALITMESQAPGAAIRSISANC